jgi:DNA-binding transcriptional LysR family regulator
MRGTQFAEMSAFAAIAQQRSFTKAAIELGVSRSALSQSLRALEERLGVRLLNRTTRSVTLTEAGRRFVSRVQAGLGELTAAIDEVNHYRQSPIGLLRIAVQPPVASFLIGPVIAQFLNEFPGINLDVAVVKMPADIVAGGFDAGIRLGEQVDGDMIAVPVMGEARFLVVAAPAYLARHPPPRTLRDLKAHDCIRNRLPNGAIFGWEFERNGKKLRPEVGGRLIVNDIDLSIQAVLDGIGLAYLLYDYVASQIATGRLMPVLEEWSPRLSGFFLYHSSRRQITGPLQALITFLKTEARRRGVSASIWPRTTVRPNYRLVGKSRL